MSAIAAAIISILTTTTFITITTTTATTTAATTTTTATKLLNLGFGVVSEAMNRQPMFTVAPRSDNITQARVQLSYPFNQETVQGCWLLPRLLR